MGSFWVTLGSLLVHDGDFESLWGCFWVSLESLLTEGGLVRPKSGNVEKVCVLKSFFNGPRGDEYFREALQLSGWNGFGVILGSLWGHFWVTLAPLWGLWDHFRCARVALESLWSVFKINMYFSWLLMILYKFGWRLVSF